MENPMDKLSILENQVNKNGSGIEHMKEKKLLEQRQIVLDKRQITYGARSLRRRFISEITKEESERKINNSYGYVIQIEDNITLWDNNPNLRLKPAWDKAPHWYDVTEVFGNKP